MMYDTWVLGCEKTNTDIWPLEVVERGTGLYMTKRALMIEHREFFDVMYHIWMDGKTHDVAPDYRHAFQLYESRLKDREGRMAAEEVGEKGRGAAS